MKTNLEKTYLHRINGKVIKYYHAEGIALPCLIVWEPGGPALSFKPYNVSERDVVDAMVAQDDHPWDRQRAEKRAKDPTFCFLTINVNQMDADNEHEFISMLDTVAALEDDEVWDILMWERAQGIHHETTGAASCPY
jgi:hypothetical protein